jgi:hypothetical protein
MKQQHTTVWISLTLHDKLLDYSTELQKQIGEPVSFSGAISHLLGNVSVEVHTVKQWQERKIAKPNWRPPRWANVQRERVD